MPCDRKSSDLIIVLKTGLVLLDWDVKSQKGKLIKYPSYSKQALTYRASVKKRLVLL